MADTLVPPRGGGSDGYARLSGPVREDAPHLGGSEEGQDRVGGFRVELYEDPEASPSPGCRHPVLSDGRG